MPTIESTTAEKRQALIRTTADPTGQAVDFAVGVGADPTSWVAGNWVIGSATTYVDQAGQTRWRAIAQSPLIGAGQALPITGPTRGARLWVRWRIGTEVIVRVVEVLEVV